MTNQAMEIVIRLNPNGTVTCAGPFDQQMLCYGLLKIAENIVTAQAAKMSESKILQVQQGVPNLKL